MTNPNLKRRKKKKTNSWLFGPLVSAVSDGLTAWETLKESAQSIDLILTEMDLPLISGFALLSLVTEHDVCKEIPVISMLIRDICTFFFVEISQTHEA